MTGQVTRPAARLDLNDVVLIVALVLLSIGVGMVWIPGGLIVPGACLLWLVLPQRAPFVARPPEVQRPEPRAPQHLRPGQPLPRGDRR